MLQRQRLWSLWRKDFGSNSRSLFVVVFQVEWAQDQAQDLYTTYFSTYTRDQRDYDGKQGLDRWTVSQGEDRWFHAYGGWDPFSVQVALCYCDAWKLLIVSSGTLWQGASQYSQTYYQGIPIRRTYSLGVSFWTLQTGIYVRMSQVKIAWLVFYVYERRAICHGCDWGDHGPVRNFKNIIEFINAFCKHVQEPYVWVNKSATTP